MEFIGGKLLQVVIALAIFAAIIGLLMLLVDRAPKSAKDKVTVIGFLAPAAILLLVGLVYPAAQTSFLAFTDSGES